MAASASRRLLRFVVPLGSTSRSITSSSRITSSMSQPSLLLTRRNSRLWFASSSSSRPFSSYSSSTSRHPPSSSSHGAEVARLVEKLEKELRAPHGAEVARLLEKLDKELRAPQVETAAAIKKLVEQGGCSSQLAATITEVVNDLVDNRIRANENERYNQDEIHDEDNTYYEFETEQGSSKLRKVVRRGALLLLCSLGYYLYEKGVIKVELDKM